MYSAVYGTVHYKETLKSFEIRVGHSPGSGLPSVAILLQCAESDVKQYTYTYIVGYTTQFVGHIQRTEWAWFVVQTTPTLLSAKALLQSVFSDASTIYKQPTFAQNWLAQCWTNAGNVGPVLSNNWVDISDHLRPLLYMARWFM